MIESYFAIWLATTKNKPKDEPLVSSFRGAWKRLNVKEKAVFIAFLLSSAVTMCLGAVVSLNNYALLPAFIFSVLVYLIFAVSVNRTTTMFRRRMLERWMAKDAAFSQLLRASLMSAGLVSCEQIRIVRDEAIRFLEHKEHRYEGFIRISIDVIIIAGFAVVIQKALPNQNTVGAVISNALLVSLMLLIFTIVLVVFVITCLKIFDYSNTLPLSKLRLFIDDLSRLLIQEEDGASSSLGCNYRQRRVRRMLN
ncbi:MULTISPECIES: hypothetical protein [Gordonibacter]|uniref:Uncharacterized protein n=1 Tax=Gordonibacter faecis TaxID=3047475 RepID=A0ABT7DIH5_9ACTN|nr:MULTISPECIES: hypothetical protein [unclassified Gordonibacter]MDJ1649331.1 hypothetical protein [Gordonibacter sp. KGMB12511]HIW75203.1 hypothetical protein [Candidatus Gordonibacter avicola]